MRYVPPEPLAAELSKWNDGNGAELEVFARYEGSYRLSASYGALFWPRFQSIGPYIIREGASRDRLNDWEGSLSADRRGVEAAMNHIHLTDYFLHHDSGLSYEVMGFLMRQLCEIHEAKLLWQFPDRPCRVVCTSPENPEELDNFEITFWQKKWETTVR